MALFSDVEIGDLIACPKEICDPPARTLRLSGADWRNSARLLPTDGKKGTFSMFMRRNNDLPENFSVGLMYTANDGRADITLLRFNGRHGTFHGLGDVMHPHWDFHIHRASEAAQDAGFTAEKYAVRTIEFTSYEQAVQHFLKVVGIKPQDALKFFPDNTQGNLFSN